MLNIPKKLRLNNVEYIEISICCAPDDTYEILYDDNEQFYMQLLLKYLLTSIEYDVPIDKFKLIVFYIESEIVSKLQF